MYKPRSGVVHITCFSLNPLITARGFFIIYIYRLSQSCNKFEKQSLY